MEMGKVVSKKKSYISVSVLEKTAQYAPGLPPERGADPGYGMR